MLKSDPGNLSVWASSLILMTLLADLQRLLAPGDAAEERARELAILDQARAIRAQIAARVGGLLPDSALELQELREERDELCGLR